MYIGNDSENEYIKLLSRRKILRCIFLSFFLCTIFIHLLLKLVIETLEMTYIFETRRKQRERLSFFDSLFTPAYYFCLPRANFIIVIRNVALTAKRMRSNYSTQDLLVRSRAGAKRNLFPLQSYAPCIYAHIHISSFHLSRRADQLWNIYIYIHTFLCVRVSARTHKHKVANKRALSRGVDCRDRCRVRDCCRNQLEKLFISCVRHRLHLINIFTTCAPAQLWIWISDITPLPLPLSLTPSGLFPTRRISFMIIISNN